MYRQRETLYTVRKNEYKKSCSKAMGLSDSCNVEEFWENRYGK